MALGLIPQFRIVMSKYYPQFFGRMPLSAEVGF